ncbi:MAG: insulinase family protein [Tissierellia bacterium]|jgi:predicted Zn-dependent peptidase|nr:insulinase family protein [Tissierellia bacterium]
MELKRERIKLGNGIYLNAIKTDKFKSSLLSWYFIRPLNRDEVTKNALIPLVLKRGTKDFPNSLEIQKKLEELYGSNLSVSINKRGDRQVLRFTMEWANGNYLGDEDYNFQTIEMLKAIIYEPLKVEGCFKAEYVAGEKEVLRRRIQSKINDKRSYAIERCIEEMCKKEKFSISTLGYIEDLDEINEENLYEQYKTLLDTSPIEVFYVGNYDEEFIEYLKTSIAIERQEIVQIPRTKIIQSVQTKKMINEDFDINQGKLVIGYRAGIPYDDKLYNGLIVASDILGGGPNSKLFKHVREEASLAYYIGTKVYKYNSIMLIDSGIEFENFQKTIEIIRKQIADMKEGNFTEADMDVSKKSIRTSTESIKDNIFLISEFFFSQSLSDDNRTLEKLIQDFEAVTKEEIMEASEKIVPDTIYFMKNKMK